MNVQREMPQNGGTVDNGGQKKCPALKPLNLLDKPEKLTVDRKNGNVRRSENGKSLKLRNINGGQNSPLKGEQKLSSVRMVPKLEQFV